MQRSGSRGDALRVTPWLDPNHPKRATGGLIRTSRTAGAVGRSRFKRREEILGTVEFFLKEGLQLPEAFAQAMKELHPAPAERRWAYNYAEAWQRRRLAAAAKHEATAEEAVAG